MSKIKIDTEGFRILSVFERVAKVHPKDFLVTDDSIYFLVEEGKIGLAVGKGGANAKKASRLLGKDVRLFEYSSEPSKLLKNLVPYAENIEISGNTAKFTVPAKARYSVIGRGGRNIKIVKDFMERHCGVTNLKFR